MFEFSMKRREMLKSEVAPGFKSLCRESQPITMLFGDELPQSIRDISQVKRMAAKSVNSSKRKSHGQQSSQLFSKRRNYGEDRSSALPESRSQEKRSKSGLTIGKSCEVYPKVGGPLRLFSLFWDRILSDQWIRDAVRGSKIEFKRDAIQYTLPNKMPFSRDEKECISVEVGKLLGKGAIRRASFHPNQFLSNLFTIPNKGGGLRPVINLKPLNHFVEYLHFKMEGLTSLLDLIRPNDFMITMDLKDAYLSVPIHADHSKYLRFEWASQLTRQV